MHLIGMLDSPYVRRVALSLDSLAVPFTHEALSVFRDFAAFAAINPVVKAPTLITDDGTVLIDSQLILEHAERLAGAARSLAPVDIPAHARAQRIVGLALAACEKTVQIVYETQLRPAERVHQPWLDRVNGQLAAAYGLLDESIAAQAPGTGWLFGPELLQADITAAVSYGFTRHMLPDALAPDTVPHLAALAARAEATPVFQRWPIT